MWVHCKALKWYNFVLFLLFEVANKLRVEFSAPVV